MMRQGLKLKLDVRQAERILYAYCTLYNKQIIIVQSNDNHKNNLIIELSITMDTAFVWIFQRCKKRNEKLSPIFRMYVHNADGLIWIRMDYVLRTTYSLHAK